MRGPPLLHARALQRVERPAIAYPPIIHSVIRPDDVTVTVNLPEIFKDMTVNDSIIAIRIAT